MDPAETLVLSQSPFLTMEEVEAAGGRICSGCQRWVTLEDLYPPCRSRPRYSAKCKSCSRQIVNDAQQRRSVNGPDPNYRRTYPHPKQTKYVAARYGMTEPELIELRQLLKNQCVVCGDGPRPRGELHVDHDHDCCPGSRSCGKCVRGLLCPNCNTQASHCGDDPKVALRRGYEALAHYLANGGIPACPNFWRVRPLQIPQEGGIVFFKEDA